MVRKLSSTYTGPLYQVRKGGPSVILGTGGTPSYLPTGGATRDIEVVSGLADAAAQDSFCGSEGCSVSILYDQSGRGNHLTAAPAGCYVGTASQPDYESNAKARSVSVGGRTVYALKMKAHDGYRRNATTSMPLGSASQGIYQVADGTHYTTDCCWDFGNASTTNCYGAAGEMNALYFGNSFWGKGAGSGPWMMGDFGSGVWAGGSGAANVVNPNNPPLALPHAFGILKISPGQYAIRVADATSGPLTTAYDGVSPASWNLKGGIILGIGEDNSNQSLGTFFEGAITAGRPSNATDDAVLQNVQAVHYGQ
jgi:hypothetical protein